MKSKKLAHRQYALKLIPEGALGAFLLAAAATVASAQPVCERQFLPYDTAVGVYAGDQLRYTSNYIQSSPALLISNLCAPDAVATAHTTGQLGYGSGLTKQYADLATGKLGSYASVNHGVAPAFAPLVNIYSVASFRDELQLNFPSASDDPSAPNYATRLYFDWDVHATWQGQGGSVASLASSITVISRKRAESTQTDQSIVELRSRTGSPNTGSTQTVAPSLGSTTSGRAIQVGDLWSYRSYVTVYGRSPVLEITAWQIAQSVSSGVVWDQYMDAYNTSTFAFFSAPQDMTFNSASGVFLTPVPEPRASLLLITGLLVTYLARRRRAA